MFYQFKKYQTKLGLIAIKNKGIKDNIDVGIIFYIFLNLLNENFLFYYLYESLCIN